MYSTKKLANGLTVLKVPIRGAKSVLVDVFVKVGSRSEDKKINGISHFLEHLFFKGSKKYPTAQELSHVLDAIGAEYNANTGKEHTQFYIKAAKKHLRFLFETLTDVLQNPIMDDEEIQREKSVIIEEINMYQDTPMRHVDDVLEEVMWPNRPLGRNIAGSKEVVRKISRNNIIKYLDTFYRPQNMILAVNGAFSETQVNALIKKYWSRLPRKKVPRWPAAGKASRGPLVHIEHKATEQYHFDLGFESFDYNDERNTVQSLLATILGGGMSSRLFTEIRERRGLAYYVKCGTTNYQDTGNFAVKAGVRLDALPEAMEQVGFELKKIKTEPVSERELNKAKEYLKGTLTLALEDHESSLGWYLEQVAFCKKIIEPDTFFTKIDRVTPKQIQAVAKEIFQSDKAQLVAIGPDKKAHQLKKYLNI